MYVGEVPGQGHSLSLEGKGMVYLRWHQDSASAPTFPNPAPVPTRGIAGHLLVGRTKFLSLA